MAKGLVGQLCIRALTSRPDPLIRSLAHPCLPVSIVQLEVPWQQHKSGGPLSLATTATVEKQVMVVRILDGLGVKHRQCYL